MTQEEKQLLLKDLCARLPYEVQCHIKHIYRLTDWIDEGDVILTGFRQDEFTKETEPLFRKPGGNPKIVFPIDSIKPYLRPLSSMTEEEFHNSPIYGNDVTHSYKIDKDGFHFIRIETYDNEVLDWLNSHHFDYRGLIEKGLALEAPKGMYKTE